LTEIKITELTGLALRAAILAGKNILDIYEKTFSIDYKSDGSPLTDADKASHAVIMGGLKSTGLPVLSEEGKEIPFDERKKWEYYWLVDPLDGTKEFIKRNGEFTVNIALMHDSKPLSGVIYQPVTGVAFAGIVGKGLFRFTNDDQTEFNEENRISTSEGIDEKIIRVIASRSHKSEETEEFILKLKHTQKNIELLNAGSSLKLCMIAEGKADIYPRFAPTMEWDTAAGHAILKSVGKNIYLHPAGTEMKYNKPVLINDWFIAR
jgi:3'(2'), 5'-bisphosphate nucleotidase